MFVLLLYFTHIVPTGLIAGVTMIYKHIIPTGLKTQTQGSYEPLKLR